MSRPDYYEDELGRIYLSYADIAKRWSLSVHAVRQRQSKGQMPPAVQIPHIKGPRWLLSDIITYENQAGTYVARPVGAAARWAGGAK